MGQPSSGEWLILLVLIGGKALVPLCSLPRPPEPPDFLLAGLSLVSSTNIPGTCQVLGWRTVLDYPARQVILPLSLHLWPPGCLWEPGAWSVGSPRRRKTCAAPWGSAPSRGSGGVVKTGMDGVATLPEMRLGGRTVRWEHMPTWSC